MFIKINSLPKLAEWEKEQEEYGHFMLQGNCELIHSKTATGMSCDFTANVVLMISLG